jgi:hypothetical protein
MFAGLAAAGLGGLLGLVGGSMTNQAQKDQANSAQEFSAAQAKQQMDFQERMRATQYQTTVEDLKKAGLNPMLGYSQGGAGTPAGAAAVGQQAQLQNPTSGLAASAAALANVKADLELKQEQTKQASANSSALLSQADRADAETDLAILKQPNVKQELKNLVEQNLLLREQQNFTSAQVGRTAAETLRTSAETGKVSAETKNIKELRAPGADPWQLRLFKEHVPINSAQQGLDQLKRINWFGKGL